MQIAVQYKPVTYRAKFLHTEIFKDLIKASTFNTRWETVVPVKQWLWDRTSCVAVNDEINHFDVYKTTIETDQTPEGGFIEREIYVCDACGEYVEDAE